MVVSISNKSFGQYISTKTSAYPGDIYHTGGKLGIGTSSPQSLLHIDDATGLPCVITLSTGLRGTAPHNWQIENSGTKFLLNYNDLNELSLNSTGQLALGTETPNNSAILQINSNSMGVLIPRMTSVEIEHIQDPAVGLLVYNSNNSVFQYYDGEGWLSLTTKEYVNNQLTNYLTVANFNNSPAGQITTTDVNNWNTVYAWGNHADAGYVTADSYNDFTNKTGNVSMWTNDVGYVTNTVFRVQMPWLHVDNVTILNNIDDNVGIGTKRPQQKLQISSQLLGDEDLGTTIRLENIIEEKKYIFWDIQNFNYKNEWSDLIFSYGNNNSSIPKITFTKDGQIGVGTTTPQADIHIKASANNPATLAFETKTINNNQSTFIVSNTGQRLSFDYSVNQNSNTIMFLETATQGGFKPHYKLKVNGTIEATNFVGNGSMLTNLPMPENIWQQVGNNIFYKKGDVAVYKKLNFFDIDGYGVSLSGSDFGLTINNSYSNDELFFVSNSGNVGIGTDEPLSSLQIERFFSGEQDYISPSIIFKEKYETGLAKSWQIGMNQGGFFISQNYYSLGVVKKCISVSDNEIDFYAKLKYNNFEVNENGDITGHNFISTDGSIILNKNGNALRLNAANPNTTEIGSSTGKILFWSSEKGYNNIIVNGIWAKDEIYVQTTNPWPDFVFNDDYELISLDSLQNYISANNHLPDIPAAEEIDKNGMPVKEMNSLLLQKTEEQTLYIIQLQQQIIEQNKRIEVLENQK